MGGCASAPKDLKDEAGSAPAPEPPREEKIVEKNEAVKVVQEAVEKAGQEENAEDKKSLGSLLNEKEVKKETTTESKAEEVPSKQKQEQQATEAPAEVEREQIENVEEKATEAKKENL